MQFATLFAFVSAFAASALANSVTFVSQDGTGRTIIFTPSAGYQGIGDVHVSGRDRVRVDFPNGWIGNWYAVSDGASRIPGMLGEVTFQGWNGLTYFDVSAIVNPGDHNGVKQLYPVGSSSPKSGCTNFPCDEAYYHPDDVQTKVTSEVDLVCTLGGSGGAKRGLDEVDEKGNLPRRFVQGGM